MDTLNSDLVLHIAQYVSVLDAASWMQTSKRYYYLIHHLRRVLGPEMVAGASATPVLTALLGLRQSPTLALCYNTERSTLGEEVAAQLPSSTVVLGAVSQSIQTCLDGKVESRSRANVLLGNLGTEATIQPFVWQAQGRHGLEWEGAMEREVREAFDVNDNHYEVFIIYGCGDGCGVLEEFVQCVQSLHPQAALVGGICSSGYVSKAVNLEEMDRGMLSSKRVAVLKQMYVNLGGQKSVLKTLTEKQTLVDYVYELLQSRPYVLEPHLEDAVFGVALGGNVPIRSVVSRGVRRLTPPDTVLQIQESRLLGPTVAHDWEQRQMRTVVPAFHVVDAIVDKQQDEDAKTATNNNTPWDVMSFLAAQQSKGDSPEFCGVRRRTISEESGVETYEDGYELYALDLHGDKLKIPVNNHDLFTHRTTLSLTHAQVVPPTDEQQQQQQTATPNGGHDDLNQAQIDFFTLDGGACAAHVEATMRQLQSQVVQNDRENVLAAIMFSCAGRGPNAGWLLRREMADANAFTSAFGPTVPCVGFYAGGEIGPLATAPAPDADPRRNLFQRGKAALQGFTAVFALFIAPKVDLRHVDIDDSPEHVTQFFVDRQQVAAV